MTVLSDIAADISSSLFDTDSGAGISATYTPRGGSAISVTVILGPESELEDGRYNGISREIYIRASDISSPAEGDKLTISGVDLTVREPTALDGYHFKLVCDRLVRAGI